VSDDESHGGFSGKHSSGSSPLHKSTSWKRMPVRPTERDMHLSMTRPLMRAVRNVTTARLCSYLLTLFRFRRKNESDEEDDESLDELSDDDESLDELSVDELSDESDDDELSDDDDELDDDELDDEEDEEESRGASS